MKIKSLIKSWIGILIALALLFCQPVSAGAAAQINFKTGRNGIVCLTIDDGYSRQYVKQALDVLRSRNVHCTFFVIGRMLKAMPDLWRQAIKDGHEICYHSMYHRLMSSWSWGAIIADVRQWNLTAKRVLGQDYKIPKLARLPGGSGQNNARIQRIFAYYGYKLVYWSADTYTGVLRISYSNTSRRIAYYIRSTTRVNSIILTHFNAYDTPALARYIDWLKSRFKLGKVSEALAAQPASTPTPATTPAPTPSPSQPTEPAPGVEATPSVEPSPTVESAPTVEPSPPAAPSESPPDS